MTSVGPGRGVQEGMDYDDPPSCREDGCKLRPVWQADTHDTDGMWITATFTDYLCGRHLPRFLWEWVGGYGLSVTLTRRRPNE